VSEPRFGVVRCPGCHGALCELEGDEQIAEALAAPARATSSGERVPLLSVCNVCFGVWFDWWAGESAAIARVLFQLPRVPNPVTRSDGTCPRDASALDRQPYLGTGPIVRRCARCFGLFATREQIDELARFAEHLPESTGPIIDERLFDRLMRLIK
jgi:hypothetical protein